MCSRSPCPYDVIPVAVKVVALDIDAFHFLVADSPPSLVLATIQPALDLESLGRGGLGNQIDDRLVVPQWLPTPV